MLKNLILLLFSLLFFTRTLKAQDQQITSKKFLGHYNYFYAHKRQNYENLQKRFQQNAKASELTKQVHLNNDFVAKNAEASKLMKQARMNNAFAGVLSTGFLLVLCETAMYLGNSEDFSWAATGAGVGMYVAAIHFDSVCNKKSKKAVDIYNAALLPPASSYFQPEFKAGFLGNGVGLQLQF